MIGYLGTLLTLVSQETPWMEKIMGLLGMVSGYFAVVAPIMTGIYFGYKIYKVHLEVGILKEIREDSKKAIHGLAERTREKSEKVEDR